MTIQHFAFRTLLHFASYTYIQNEPINSVKLIHYQETTGVGKILKYFCKTSLLLTEDAFL